MGVSSLHCRRGHEDAPDVLAFSFLPPRQPTRTSGIDCLVFGIINYSRPRGLPEATIRGRCCRWLGLSDRAVRAGLRRLEVRSAIDVEDYQIRRNAEFVKLSRDRGAHFRIRRRDLDAMVRGDLDELQVRLLGLIPTRTAPGRAPWADSNEHLAELLGACRNRVADALAVLQQRGLLDRVGTYKTRNGKVLSAYATAAQLDATTAQRMRDDRAISDSPPERPRTVGPSAPPAAAQAGLGPDDPELARPAAEPVLVATTPWQQVGSLEAKAIEAATSWPNWWANLEVAAAKHHLDTNSPDGWFAVLTAAGILVMRHGDDQRRRSCRGARRDLAEFCAKHQGEPSLALEWLYLEGQRLEAEGCAPWQVARSFVNAVTPKESTAEPKPMSALLDQLVRPQTRPIGTFAYPATWWRGAVPAEQLAMIDRTRILVDSILAAEQVRDRLDGNEIAVAQVAAAARVAELRRTLVDQIKSMQPRCVIRSTIVSLVRAGVPRPEIERLAQGAAKGLSAVLRRQVAHRDLDSSPPALTAGGP